MNTFIGLIIDAKCTDPETGSFTEWIADYLLKHLSTLRQPSNEPLTLEELRGMDGPAWAACKPIEGGDGYWCLCRHGTIITPAASVYDVGEISHWVFYRRPPEVSP